jgi:two-component system, response regulator
MLTDQENIQILLAEDDPDDVFLTLEALRESAPLINVKVVADGEELFAYLKKFSPQLILLDLNMPKMDGRQALKTLKTDKTLHHIPVVVFTTSKSQEDINFSYQMGVNSYISKPDSFDELVESMKVLEEYWFATAQLPESL